MSGAQDHDRIIAEAAKRALAPIGFRRKGQSRVWLADRGYWLSVVEFQPSGRSKGSYLNVSPHWLWGLTDTLSFDRPVHEVRSFIEFGDATEFKFLADEQAATAARTSLELSEIYQHFPHVAQVLAGEEKDKSVGGWPAFNAGMAAGIVGECEAARVLLQSTLDSFANWNRTFDEPLRELIDATTEPSRFSRLAKKRIAGRRLTLGLQPFELPDFSTRP